MKKGSLFTAILLVLTAPPMALVFAAAHQESPPPGEPLTLRTAVDLALRTHPLLRLAEAGRDAAAGGLDEARAGRLPSLQFSETFTNSNNPVYVFGSLLEQGHFGPQNFEIDSLNNPGSLSNFRSALRLRLPLFDRFQTYARIDEAEIRQDQAAEEIDWTAQQVRLEVVQAYYGLLVAERRREVAEEAVATASAELDNVTARVEEGLAVTSDQLAMQVQVADFRQQLVQAEGDLVTARATLNSLLSLPLETPHQIAGRLDEKGFDLASQGELISRALAERPDYQNAGREIEAANQRLRAARGQYWPDLNLFADYGHSGRHWGHGSADFAVGASLTFNIVDMGRSGRIQQVAAAVEQARARESHLARQIRLEVVQAAQAYSNAAARLQLAARAVDQAAEALRIVEDRHEVGLTTITEVLRAQTALLKARLDHLGAVYGTYISYARVLLATGSLDDVSSFGA